MTPRTLAGTGGLDLLLGIALAAAASPLGCGDDGSQDTADGGDRDTSGSEACPWDGEEGADRATTLPLDVTATGHLCPRGDVDWFAVTAPAGSDLVRVTLNIDATFSPVDPSYAVWDDAGSEVVAAPLSSESAVPSAPLDIVHKVGRERFLISVRDRAGDAEDTRHPYELTAAAFPDPDPQEPNDAAERATTAPPGTYSGYVASRGDEDWYAFEAPAGSLLDLALTMPAGGIAPGYRVVDAAGATLLADENPGGTAGETALETLRALGPAGTYYLVVFDSSGTGFDYETPYELRFSLRQDPDTNEANNDDATATGLASIACAAEFSEWVSHTGYIGSLGDTDWFSLELSSCGRGVIELEIDFDDPIPDELQAAVRVISGTESDAYACTLDQDCTEIVKRCAADLDCAGYGASCLAHGRCAGSGSCLQNDHCGLLHYTAASPEQVPGPGGAGQMVNPNRGHLRTAIPTRARQALSVVVDDYRSDAFSVDASYTIRVRARRDPDTHEASERYTVGPPTAADDPALHIAYAAEVPVHDCTTAAGDAGLDCCDDNTWEEGYLSYLFDQDWYAYAHPCPGRDCMVRINYEIAEGPVDHFFQVYRGDQLWFDTVAPFADQETHAATSGSFGGLAPTDDCFYAYQGHASEDESDAGTPFWYHLTVRDTVYVAEGQEEDGTWDWDADQRYRFCIEKIADGCREPCKLYDAGCGSPPPGE